MVARCLQCLPHVLEQIPSLCCDLGCSFFAICATCFGADSLAMLRCWLLVFLQFLPPVLEPIPSVCCDLGPLFSTLAPGRHGLERCWGGACLMLQRCLPVSLHASLADLGARKMTGYDRNHPEDLAIWERGAGEVLGRCLPDAGEVPACLHACMPCSSGC